MHGMGTACGRTWCLHSVDRTVYDIVIKSYDVTGDAVWNCLGKPVDVAQVLDYGGSTRYPRDAAHDVCESLGWIDNNATRDAQG